MTTFALGLLYQIVTFPTTLGKQAPRKQVTEYSFCPFNFIVAIFLFLFCLVLFFFSDF